MNCPKCNLFNPKSAQICDCGFNFDTGKMGQSLLSSEDSLSLTMKIFCFFIPLMGIGYFLLKHERKPRSAMLALLLTISGILVGTAIWRVPIR